MKVSIRTLVEEVLEKGFVMSLATVGDDGVWVADVIYVRDESLNLYWISSPSSRHSKALEKNPRVACTITPVWETDKEESLQISGAARRVEGDIFEFEQMLQKKRNMPTPEKPGEILKDGYIWYVLKPDKIELTHNKLFGYEKKSLDLS